MNAKFMPNSLIYIDIHMNKSIKFKFKLVATSEHRNTWI